MKILLNEDELSSTLNITKIRTGNITFNFTPPDLVTHEIYTSDYECGCGEKHSVSGSDGSVTIMQEMKFSMGINVVLRCKNDWYTYIKKTVFSNNWKSIWTIKSLIFDKAVENDSHFNRVIKPYLLARDS
jgi:hypothetical protein